jgi:hypothetical protein
VREDGFIAQVVVATLYDCIAVAIDLRMAAESAASSDDRSFRPAACSSGWINASSSRAVTAFIRTFLCPHPMHTK